VKMLLEKGAKPAVKNGAGRTAASFAQSNGHASIVKLLGG